MVRSCVGVRVGAVVVALAGGTAANAANPWADSVVSYVAGSGAPGAFQTPGVALGEPTRFTGQTAGFPGSVTPFAAAFEGDEIVSIGRGGSLTLRFDEPVMNDAANPWGIDLLVFGNAFFYSDDFSPIAQNVWQVGGRIEVSSDGSDWRAIAGVDADGVFPTLGYSDEVNPFGGAAGSLLSDFTKPVDPNFAWQGLGLAGLVAGYAGSGGGAGVDIGSVGLSSVSFVRFSLASDAALSKFEIDAVSDVAVPGPGVLGLVGAASVMGLRRRRGA
jgi:hypothetical protein